MPLQFLRKKKNEICYWLERGTKRAQKHKAETIPHGYSQKADFHTNLEWSAISKLK